MSSAQNPVKIDVTVPTWAPLLGAAGSATGYSSTLSTGAFTVVSGTSRVAPKKAPDTEVDDVAVDSGTKKLTVTGSAFIRFRFGEQATNAEGALVYRFYPIGVGFFRKGTGDQAVIPMLSEMPRDGVTLGPKPGDNNSNNDQMPWIQISDACANAYPDGYYYIVVQGNSGELGVIDPDIDNEAAN